MELTQKHLKELLHYEPTTGIFTRLTSAGGYKIGTVWGCINSLGYVKGQVAGIQTYGHRLAFLYMTGSIPAEIDHIDNNSSNNVWTNLREATRGQNQYNSSLHKDSTSLVKGLSYKETSQAWAACVIYNGKAYTKTISAPKECLITKSILTGWLLGVRELLHGEFANHG